MEDQFFDYNFLKMHLLDFHNQNFNSYFSPIELNEELNNEYIKKSVDEKQEIQNKKFEEQKYKDLLLYNEQIKVGNLLFTNYNPFFTTTNENNSYLLYNEMNPQLDKQLMYISRKEKIFEIIKTNKKIGRLKKNSTKKGKHNNLSQDNIIRKIKRRFLEKLRIYINNEYRNFFLNKKIQKNKSNNWLKKIDPGICRKIKKEDNLKWFETKISDIFSESISERYSNSSKDLNKRKIKRVFKMKEDQNLINIFNSNIEFYYDKYRNDEKINGFKTIKDDVNELKMLMENANQKNIEEYIKKYEYIAKNLKDIFLKKVPRNVNNKIKIP